MHNLVLASQSPRRKTLLEENGFLFQTFSIEVSEILNENLNLQAEICRVAQSKAEAAAKAFKPLELQDYLFLSADTMVVFEGRALGKPNSRRQARETLRLLSGRKHDVQTGFCLLDLRTGHGTTGLVRSEVTFHFLSHLQIEKYVDEGTCMDKAGSYGIQDIGEVFVKSVVGPRDNIIGLPVQQVIAEIERNGWDVRRKL